LKLALFYSTESSENLNQNRNDLTSFDNNFYGFNLNYSVLNRDIFRNKKIFFEITPTIGDRKGKQATSKQIKLQAKGHYLWQLDLRNSIFIKNEIGVLNSDQYFSNELFRIGGINSIRGFNEQSILVKNYTFFNIEYRLLTSSSSYLYTISDFGFINTSKKQNLLSLGLGYLLINNNSKINLSLAAGKRNTDIFDINNLKLAVGWINYF
jgi:hemolysin activation/secretion protein